MPLSAVRRHSCAGRKLSAVSGLLKHVCASSPSPAAPQQAAASGTQPANQPDQNGLASQQPPAASGQLAPALGGVKKRRLLAAGVWQGQVRFVTSNHHSFIVHKAD